MAFSKFLLSKTLIYFVVTSLIVGTHEEDEGQFESLPFCNDQIKQDKKLVLISTLDGKFSALNAENGGVLSWSLPTGPGPMLSSSIHRLELTNNGHWVRMIPSLSGHLYKFDGESIEAVPVNAHQLLKNSFRYSEDLVISGGRETRTYGVDLNSGRLLYECTMRGCDNFTDELTDGSVLVVQRETQTIRAVEPRTGSERWNYSVAEHDVKLMNDPNADCHATEKGRFDDLQIKVIVPEGLVCALSKKDPHKVLWKHKFDTPVVHAWQYSKGAVESLDLFSGSLMPPWNAKPSHRPSLYVGMHEKQLYIQESVTVQRGVAEEKVPLLTDDKPSARKIPWKPYAASSKAIGWPEKTEVQQISSDDAKSDSQTTALSVLYGSEYVNGNGFYLFNPGDEGPTNTCNDNDTLIEGEEEPFPFNDDEDTPVQIIIVSLWYWWKEVLIISMTTALLFNLFFTQRFLYLLQRNEIPQQIVVVQTPSKQSSDSGFELRRTSSSEENYTPNFSSRYLDDFEQVQCLGRGGFGVVFEARKKIDDCSYAVKRIALPNRKESRDRVMREVKALAKLEHPHIVRYYHSWLECPPPGWQEEQDREWVRDVQSRDSLLPDDNTVDESTEISKSNQLLPYFKQRNSDVAVTMPSDDSSLKEPTNEISDSFIQFQNSKSGIPNSKSEVSDSFIQFQNSKSGIPNSKSEVSDSFIQFQNSKSEMSDSFIQFQNSNGTIPTKSNGTYIPLNYSSSTSCQEESVQVSSEEDSPVRVRLSPMYLYIQMQLCRKESLREWLQKRNTEVCVKSDESLHVFHQIAQAVEYVHQQGLIHRDLKPSNIFFSMDGHIKVGDFGLVTDSLLPAGTEDGHRTPSEEFKPWPEDDGVERRHTANVGTKLYMSPEQMLGRAYDHKVDIYSLGLILFELLWPFSTQMERADALQALREKLFPNSFQEQYKLEFGIVFDAGSTHTEMLLYSWEGDKWRDTGVVKEITNCKLSGGIGDQFSTNPSGVGPYLDPCLKMGTSKIPEDELPDSPVFLAATAGLRMLQLENSSIVDEILGNVSVKLSKSGMLFKSGDAKVISGQQEAVSGWVSVNYLSHKLLPGTEPHKPGYTLGALDLGGASTQITFETDDNQEGEDRMSLRLYGQNYKVSAISYLCHGIAQIILRHKVSLLQGTVPVKAGKLSINNPCLASDSLHSSDVLTQLKTPCSDTNYLSEFEGTTVEYNGTSDAVKCLEQIRESVLNPVICKSTFKYGHCIDTRPPARPQGTKFVGFSTFFYAASGFNATTKVNSSEFLNKVNEICALNQTALLATHFPEVGDQYKIDMCYEGLYIYLLLKEVYQFTEEEWTTITYAKTLNETSVGWTLGFMIQNTNAIPAEDAVPGIPVPWFVVLALGFIALVGISIWLVLSTFKFTRPIRVDESHPTSYGSVA